MENKKKKKTQIDIILPNYNSYKFIEETIKSIKNQNFSHWKLTIVDDNSNQKTKKILKKILKNKKIQVYWLKKNRGAEFCRNYAIKKTKSPFIAFIDSDVGSKGGDEVGERPETQRSSVLRRSGFFRSKTRLKIPPAPKTRRRSNRV